jgi:hypothetical protein
MPGPECRVLRILSDDRVLDESVTKVVDDLGDGEDAAEALVEAFLSLGGCLPRGACENDCQSDYYSN